MKEWHGDDIEAEDIVLEAENNEPPKGGDCEKMVTKLKADLEKTAPQKQEYIEGWQRAKADYLNLLKLFDRIYVFDKGRITDEGSFDDLLQRNASFKKSWEQFVATQPEHVSE